jgi:non-specific serine/threonine protein kinase
MPSGALPTWRTRLVGRNADRAALRELLLDRSQRLVVITGPGGVGKTRLAAQVAADLAPSFRDGARFLPLAPVPAGADLDAAVAWHLGLQDVQDRTYRDTIVEHLATREILLVIDNVEHVPEIGGLLTFLHARCPAVAMLVTSRRTLDVYGEVVHPVLPLSHEATAGAPRPGGRRASEAARLLRDRVRALDPAFDVTPANATAIAAVCDRLGGLPLAIELTAPRLVGRDPAALLTEMAASDAEGATDAMEATIRLSYDRLDPGLQRVFRALCVMCGRWTIDDVLPILPPDIGELAAIDAIDALVRRSLLTPDAGEGETRVAVNPVLRQFGRRLLDDLGEATALAGRHADRMVALAEAAEPELTGPDQRWWLGRIESLHDDIRDAHHHLLGHGRAVDALRLAAALWRYAYARGHYREIRRMLEIALAEVTGHDELRARALNGVGLLAIMLRDPEPARAAHRQALGLATSLGLDREIAIARIGLADLNMTVDGDTDGALRHLSHAAAAYERLSDARGTASVLTNRGYIEWQRGLLDQAAATHEEAGALYERAGDTRGIAWSRTNTGRIATQRGRHHEAVPLLLVALDGYGQIGDVSGIAEILEALAAVAVGTGDLSRASTLLGAAATTRAGIGSTLTGLDRDQRDATLAAARQGPDHDDAWAQGERLGIDEAVALARAFPVPAARRGPGAEDARTLARKRFGITTREHEVLTLLDAGMTDQEMADRLGLSVRTVNSHTAALMRKLDVNSRVAVVHAAHQAGIVPTHQP